MSLPQWDVLALSSVMKSATEDGSIATLIDIQRRNKLYLNSFVIPCEDQVDGIRIKVTCVEFCGSKSTHFFVSPICSCSIGYNAIWMKVFLQMLRRSVTRRMADWFCGCLLTGKTKMGRLFSSNLFSHSFVHTPSPHRCHAFWIPNHWKSFCWSFAYG